jgi:hypothetical protein
MADKCLASNAVAHVLDGVDGGEGDCAHRRTWFKLVDPGTGFGAIAPFSGELGTVVRTLSCHSTGDRRAAFRS